MRPGKAFLAATGAAFVAGTLDLGAAIILSRLDGAGPVNLLQTIASGPFGDRAFSDFRFLIVGFVVHYAIVGLMALAYITAAPRVPLAATRPLLTGAVYGLLLWVIMTLVVEPLRWPDRPLPTADATTIAGLLAHIVLVGMPIGLIYAWAVRPRHAPAPRRRRSEPARGGPRR